ncbi:hypothetical protein G9A89_015815 [Geosiphon pyriformis]|nr:hypothetical protein G9A89_015815 [Geosiphon pyriformis]
MEQRYSEILRITIPQPAYQPCYSKFPNLPNPEVAHISHLSSPSKHSITTCNQSTKIIQRWDTDSYSGESSITEFALVIDKYEEKKYDWIATQESGCFWLRALWPSCYRWAIRNQRMAACAEFCCIYILLLLVPVTLIVAITLTILIDVDN